MGTKYGLNIGAVFDISGKHAYNVFLYYNEDRTVGFQLIEPQTNTYVEFGTWDNPEAGYIAREGTVIF